MNKWINKSRIRVGENCIRMEKTVLIIAQVLYCSAIVRPITPCSNEKRQNRTLSSYFAIPYVKITRFIFLAILT